MSGLPCEQGPKLQMLPTGFLRRVEPLLACLLSGVLLSTAFPPLEWWPMAFLGLIPVFLARVPRRNSGRALCGFSLGYAHFLLSLWWLNTVGFGAGMILALICACFPMAWYWLYCVVVWSAKPREVLSQEATPEIREEARRPGAGLWVYHSTREFLRTGLGAAALWTALEWVRSWIFTGFPWDLLGISQAFAPTRLLAVLAGPYGISFLCVLTAFLLAVILRRPRQKEMYAPLAVVLFFCVAFCFLESRRGSYSEQHSVPLRITAIQGNIPECREWTEELFQSAWRSYADRTIQGMADSPDAFLWPEGALPCHLTFPPYAQALRYLLQKIQTPLLLGTLDERDAPQGDGKLVFNSAFLLDKDSAVLLAPNAQRKNYYDKTHRVPFGEYVPFSEYVPWLGEKLGLGRDLTPGKNFPLFQIPRKDAAPVACGVNICFEDVFPEISRRFTLEGAQMLITITNDCWYGTSAGARQHQAHAVFRAIENRRPLLRSGNNSHTCLITEKGEILEPITDQDGGDFCAGWHTYQCFPPRKDAPTTLYARCGNLFPWLCAAASLGQCLWLAYRAFQRKRKLHDAMKKAKA